MVMLCTVWLRIFARKSRHLFIEELNIPCVIQCWRLIYLRDVLTFFLMGKLCYTHVDIYSEKYCKQNLDIHQKARS